MPPIVRRTLAFTPVFALALFLGRMSVLPESGLALFWPAAGVGAAWALSAHSRREVALIGWVVLVLASTGNALTGLGPVAGAVLGSSNVVMALGTRWVAQRILDRSRPGSSGHDGARTERLDVLHTQNDLYRLLLASATASCASAAVGMIAVWTTGVVPTVPMALGFVLRIEASIVVVAGVFLAVRSHAGPSRRAWSVRRWLTGFQLRPSQYTEAIALMVVTTLVVWLVFGPGHTLPMGFVPFAVLCWGGLRMPVPVAALHASLVAVSALVLLRTVDGGPFSVVVDPFEQALTVQAFMMLAVGLSLLISTGLQERSLLTLDLARSERRARQRAEELRAITETVPDGLLVIDRAGRALLHNRAGAPFVQAEVDGAGDLPLAAVKHYLDGSVVPAELLPSTRALLGETVRDFEILLDDPDSGQHVYDVSAAPLYPDDDGGGGGDGREPDRAVLLFHEVTHDREHMDQLQRAIARADRLFEDAPHGVAVLSVDGRLLRANAALAAMVGKESGELVGSPLVALSPGRAACLDHHLVEVLRVPGQQVTTDCTLDCADADELHVSISSRVLSGGEEGADDVVLVNVVDVSERHRFEQRLTHLADHDVLTGLVNRRRFDAALLDHLERCRRYGPRGSLLLIDLDHFKEVNDSLGHAAGDQLIVSTAACLRRSLRTTDVVGRLGGDEFAVLLPEGNRSEAETVARSLVDGIRAHTSSLGGINRRVTASIGVVPFAAATTHQSDPLSLADMLMYDAKDAGRDGFAVLEDHELAQPRSGARLAWKARLEHALDNDELVLHLQPIRDVATGRVTSAEALVRLAERDGTLVMPGSFVHVAERTGLATALDAWVVRKGVEVLKDLRRFEPDFQLEVNLSGQSIGDPRVERAITEALREHDVPPHALILEVTETAAAADIPAARAFAERLSSIGAKFALDDFGAGFGSFYYLKHLMFDYIKIDGEFVAKAHSSSIDQSILASITALARDLGKTTVAEFVADDKALEVVVEQGIDMAQGYLIGRPTPVADFVREFLTRPRSQRLALPASRGVPA